MSPTINTIQNNSFNELVEYYSLEKNPLKYYKLYLMTNNDKEEFKVVLHGSKTVLKKNLIISLCFHLPG